MNDEVTVVRLYTFQRPDGTTDDLNRFSLRQRAFEAAVADAFAHWPRAADAGWDPSTNDMKRCWRWAKRVGWRVVAIEVHTPVHPNPNPRFWISLREDLR